MKNSKPNRYIIKPQTITENVAIVPKIESLLSDALVVIGTELARYRAKVQRGVSLDLKEGRLIKEYVEAIVKLNKEAREAARAQDLSNLTNEELLQLATELLANNKKDKIEEDK